MRGNVAKSGRKKIRGWRNAQHCQHPRITYVRQHPHSTAPKRPAIETRNSLSRPGAFHLKYEISVAEKKERRSRADVEASNLELVQA